MSSWPTMLPATLARQTTEPPLLAVSRALRASRARRRRIASSASTKRYRYMNEIMETRMDGIFRWRRACMRSGKGVTAVNKIAICTDNQLRMKMLANRINPASRNRDCACTKLPCYDWLAWERKDDRDCGQHEWNDD